MVMLGEKLSLPCSPITVRQRLVRKTIPRRNPQMNFCTFFRFLNFIFVFKGFNRSPGNNFPPARLPTRKRLRVRKRKRPDNTLMEGFVRGGPPKSQSNMQPQKNKANNYQEQLVEFAVSRQPSTSKAVSTIPSHELIWVRNTSGDPQQLEPLAMQADYELEEGEIVDLLEESVKAVENSRRSTLYFEDRVGSTSISPNNMLHQVSSDEVICLDSSIDVSKHEDDSVIFISEEKIAIPRKKLPPKLAKPDCLNSPAVNNLLSLVRSPKKFLPHDKFAKLTPKRRLRQQNRARAFQLKKSMENPFDGIVSDISAEENQEPLQPITLTTADIVNQPSLAPVVKPKEKRIILIDGSNVAMQYNDEENQRRTDANFSAEGLKICIDYFESKGFQVKAVVPEYRVCRNKSSNHELMNELRNTGKLMLTPRKSYDDRVILEGALRLDAAVVSNDFFRKFS